MNIIYVAKHENGGNDDEGAVGYALEMLGHRVDRIEEREAAVKLRQSARLRGADLLLFHKWNDPALLSRLKGYVNRAFWYFDLVYWGGDPTLERRGQERMAWMKNVMPHVEVGFCTDGDWASLNTDKLFWLPQGADERVIGRGDLGANPPNDLLFTGIVKGGRGRMAFVQDIYNKYGDRLCHITHGCHREQLKDRVANSKIVLCPDSPSSDRYWSNRVYNAAGFGAFMLHPYCHSLVGHFHANKELVYYHTRKDMYELVDYYLGQPEKREDIGAAALQRVKAEHTYRHRLQILLGRIKHGASYGKPE